MAFRCLLEVPKRSASLSEIVLLLVGSDATDGERRGKVGHADSGERSHEQHRDSLDHTRGYAAVQHKASPGSTE